MKYLILHKSEWERLKRQYEPHKIPPKDNEHLQRLHELSQKWIRTWPDTVQGHMEVVSKNETKNKNKIASEIKKFALRKKKDTSTPAILKARKLIFDDSCYGRQLISSLIESKTLEKRAAQIKFNKELNHNHAAREKEKLAKEEQYILDLIKIEEEKLKKSKDKEHQMGMINKTMSSMQRKIRTLEKNVEKQKEIEDLRLINQLIENDEKREDTSKCEREQYIECTKLKKEMEANRAKKQEKEERINRVWQEYGNKMRCMEKFTREKIQRETSDALKKQQVYRMLEAIKEEENNKYNAFVEKGIKDHERMLLKEEDNVETRDQENKKKSFVKDCKETKHEKPPKKPFCNCDRQTLFCSSKEKKKFIPESEMGKKSLDFLQPSKSLVEKLKMREKESSPYNGTKAAHEQFAKEANNILKECHYKRMAEKVIDEYKKVNCLNANDLSITNSSIS